MGETEEITEFPKFLKRLSYLINFVLLGFWGFGIIFNFTVASKMSCIREKLFQRTLQRVAKQISSPFEQ